jgi:hypothetical protein
MRRSAAIRLLPLGIALSGCASGLGRVRAASFADARQHSIFVDGDGRPLLPDTMHHATTLGFSARDDSLYGEWIHGIMVGLAASGRHDVLLRIHGGLTPLNMVAGDTGLTARIMRESPYYPVFINWESSIQDSYFDQLLYIRDGRAYRGWDVRGIWLAPIYLAADAGRAVAHAPVTWTVQGRKFLSEFRANDGIVSNAAKREQAALFPDASRSAAVCSLQQPITSTGSLRAEYGRDCRSGWERALDAGLAVVTTIGVMPYGRDAGRYGHNAVGRLSIKLPPHLFWPGVKLFSPWATQHIAWLPLRPISSLLIDMVGGPAYENMHRRTETMFRPSAAVGSSGPDLLKYRPAGGAVAQLLDSLQAFVAPTADRERPVRCSWSAQPRTIGRVPGEPYRVSIVAASLGTNAAAEIVGGCPGIPFRDIVFLGAAATRRDVEQGILPYLLADTLARVFNLTLNPAADRDEWTAGLFFSTQGSLVEWLDGFMTTPQTDGDRVFGKYENALSAASMFPDAVRDRVYFKSFGLRSRFGNYGVPFRHADLANQPFWKCEYWMPKAYAGECR